MNSRSHLSKLLADIEEEENEDKEALRSLRIAAENGDAEAQVNLGTFYEWGRGGLDRDSSEASRLYKLAADQGNVNGQIKYGTFLARNFRGVSAENLKAEHILRLVSDQGYSSAQVELGLLYIKRNDHEAARLLPRPVTPRDVKKFTNYCGVIRSIWRHHEILFDAAPLRQEILQSAAAAVIS